MSTRDSKGRFIKGAAADYGRRGGRKTVQRHGNRHMSRIGQQGYQTTLERHFQGDKQAFDRWLKDAGLGALERQQEY